MTTRRTVPGNAHADRAEAAKTEPDAAMLHVAVYAGVPRANHAIKIIKQTYKEMEAENGQS